MDINKINLPKDFLKAEYRTGYYVSEKMKKVWAVELDLLAKFVDVCERNNLNYFMDGGTLLGAVRHQGFVPWDDDADVIMPREDYNKLFKIGEKEFTYPYFLQSTLSENGFFRSHLQLRNSATTGFIGGDKNRNINRGIFLDIFVLDGIPDSQFQQRILKKRIWLAKKIFEFQLYKNYSKLRLTRKMFYNLVHTVFKFYPYKKYFQHFNLKILGGYSNKNTKLVGDITLEWRKNVQWPREWWYSGYVYLPFENLKLRAPRFYKEVLERQYGDFMKIPENVNAPNGRCHGSVTFEPEISYKEYFKLQDLRG